MTHALLSLILTSVALSAVAQLVLKIGMSSDATRLALQSGGMNAVVSVASNPYIWLGLGVYGLGTVLWLGVLSKIDVSQAYPFVGLGFLLTMLFGLAFLGEQVSIQRIAGTLLVIAGVYLVAGSG